MRTILHSQATDSVSSADAGTHVMVGRQPIYNDVMGIYAYELLFRAANRTIYQMDPDQATAQVLSNTVINFGLENLVGRSRAAVNVTKAFLEHVKELPLEPTRMVLDLSADIVVDRELLTIVESLVAKGFVVSVEGIEQFEKIKPLLPLASILRIDVHKVPRPELEKWLDSLSRYRKLDLLALKIETLEQCLYYRDLGFKYCQGYFLSKPKLYSARDLSANKLVVLNLLAAVNSSDTESEQIAGYINQDVSLSYKLLKLINSPFFGLANKIESIQQAILLLGRTELRSWVSVIALSNMGDKPAAAIELAMVRAKMCELLAARIGMKTDSFFTVGMFSALDILMDQPLSRILLSLPLSDAVKSAIIEKEGVMGDALVCALAYESSDWAYIRFEGLSDSELLEVYMEAIAWAGDLMNIL